MTTYPASRSTGERVLAAASQLFAERGYSATTTRQIAQKAGVNEVTLFRQFGNKAGILNAWAQELAANQAGFAVAETPEPTDLRATLNFLANLEVKSAMANGGAAMRLAFEAATVPEVAAVLGDGPRANLGGLADYFRERQQAGDLRRDIDARVMAEAFFSLTSSVVMIRTVLIPEAAPDADRLQEVVGQLLELFLTGVLPQEQTSEAGGKVDE